MEELRKLLLARGASLVGFADLRELPEDARQGLPFGVSIAVALDPKIIASLRIGPTESYVHLYHHTNAFLNDLAQAAVEFLTSRGFHAVAQPATRPITDSDTLSTPLPHKTVATRAGLGWIGKNAVLVTPSFGTAVRLTSVLTDAPLPPGKPINQSHCGSCIACVSICPGKAATGVNWKVGMDRALYFDAFACQKASRNRPDNVNLSRRLCGVCLPACPHTVRYLRKAGAL